MSRLLGSLVGLLLGLGVLHAPAAHAQRQVLSDPAGDVWSVHLDRRGTQTASGPDQDLRGGSVRHGARRVTVVWSYADLRPRGELVVHRVLLRTGDGTTYEARVDTGPGGSRAGTASVFRGDQQVACRTRHRVGHRADRVRLVVPRGCLGSPRRVRARLDTYRAMADGSFRRDNAHDRSARTDRWTRSLRRG